MQVNSSLSSLYTYSSYTETESPEGGTTLQTQTEETSIDIETGSPDSEPEDGLAMVLGGEATAVGQDTAAIGTIEGQVADVGTGLVAEGSATFTASGETSDAEPAYAFADSYGAVTEADTVVAVNSKSSESIQSETGSTWTETSTTELLAVELDLSGSEDPSIAIDTTSQQEPEEQAGVSDEEPTWQPDDVSTDTLDGNLALIIVDVQASADDSLVLVDASALTIEDQLSVISGSALLAVG